MAVRILRVGSKGEDVRVIQKAFNRHGAGLNPDGDFGQHTRSAVVRFQQENSLQVDGEVGPQTRRALFPLVAITVNVLGMRRASSGQSRISLKQQPNFGLPPLTLPPLTLPPLTSPSLLTPPLTLPMPALVNIPGLKEPIAAAPVSVRPPSSGGTEWQQFTQSQRQFTGLFVDRLSTLSASGFRRFSTAATMIIMWS